MCMLWCTIAAVKCVVDYNGNHAGCGRGTSGMQMIVNRGSGQNTNAVYECCESKGIPCQVGQCLVGGHLES